ncbi:MAG: hypothetical protein MJE77_36115 [Proteobacteria bacterium]|nr:hypothetical protein [Pseudomonadota bacterium]
MWNIYGSGEPKVLVGHWHSITAARFSPDGDRIVTVAQDGIAKVWLSDDSGEPTLVDPPRFDMTPELFEEVSPSSEPVPVRLDQVRVERGRRFGDIWLGLTLWQALGLDALLRVHAEWSGVESCR